MKLRDWWQGRTASAQSPQDKQRIDSTVERVVETTNPSLRYVSNYKKKLGPAVAASLDYVHDLVASLPPAREASTAAWAGDTFIKALFASPDELVRAFSRAPDLQAHVEKNPGLAEAYAVLGMAMSERKVLGMAMEGDLLRRDVAQTNVSFSDHRVRICGCTEAELRDEIERRLVDQLALEGLAQIAADDSRRDALKQESALLKARSRLLENEGAGIRGALGGEAAGAAKLAELRSQMMENSRELASLGVGAELLDRQLEHIRSVLAEPARHLYVSSRRLRLDGMNVLIEDPAAQAGVELEFLVARLPGTVPALERAFVLVRFPRGELLTAQQLRGDIARWLI